MSKQRNEPNDILSEVMEYDEESAVAGTSADDEGDESATMIPDHLNPNQLTRLQLKVWKDWSQSLYKEPTNENITEFVNDKEYSRPTARKVIMRGEREHRNLKQLRESEKLAAIIWAHEGLDSSPIELEKKYPLSDDTFNRTCFSYTDIIENIENDYGTVTKEDVIEAINNSAGELGHGKQDVDEIAEPKNVTGSTLENPTGWKSKVKQYALENPTADVESIKVATGVNADLNQVRGYYSNLKGHGYIDQQEETNKSKATEQQQTTTADSKLQITLEFTDSEALELINGDTEPFDVRKRVVEKVVEKAFQ